MQIDGLTKLVGVFGSPIAHTASPAMHNAAFAALKLNWAYLAFPVDPERLAGALAGARHLGMVGVNLTVPHKVLALKCVDEIDPEARKLGAVNTIVFRADHARGLNTDGYGFVKAIHEEFNLELEGKQVLVLGAGGAGRAIAVKCALEGAAKVFVANRTSGRTGTIAQEAAAAGVEFAALPLTRDALQPALSTIDLVVNTTSVGLKEGDSLGLSRELFSPHCFVYDTIYRPAKTKLLIEASEAGATVANGTSMLLYQGARAFEIWTEQKAPLNVMRRALRAALGGTTT